MHHCTKVVTLCLVSTLVLVGPAVAASSVVPTGARLASATAPTITWYGPARMGTVAGVRMPVCTKPKAGLLPQYPIRTATGITAKKTMRVSFQQGKRLVVKRVRRGTLVCKWVGRKPAATAGSTASGPAAGTPTDALPIPETGEHLGVGLPFVPPTMDWARTYAFRAAYTSGGQRVGDWLVASDFVLHGGSYVIDRAYTGDPRKKNSHEVMLVTGGDLPVSTVSKIVDLFGQYEPGWVWDPSQGCPGGGIPIEVGAPGFELGAGPLVEVNLTPEASHALDVANSLNRNPPCPIAQ